MLLLTDSEAINKLGCDGGVVMQRDALGSCHALEPATPLQSIDSTRRRTPLHTSIVEPKAQQESNKQNQRHS